MAFIDDFNKLVVTKGQQQKVTDKDKAIIDLANEVANGGGGQTKRIVACWKVISENEFEKIDKKEGEETFEINSFADGNRNFLFTTDENEPNNTLENVALIVNLQDPAFTIINIKAITSILSESDKDGDDNLVIPDTKIRVFDNLDFQPYLSIDIKYTTIQ